MLLAIAPAIVVLFIVGWSLIGRWRRSQAALRETMPGELDVIEEEPEPRVVHDLVAWDNLTLSMRVIWRAVPSRERRGISIEVMVEADESVEPFFGSAFRVGEWREVALVDMALDGRYDAVTQYGLDLGLPERTDSILKLAGVLTERFLNDSYVGNDNQFGDLLSLKFQRWDSIVYEDASEGRWALYLYDSSREGEPPSIHSVAYDEEREGEIRTGITKFGPSCYRSDGSMYNMVITPPPVVKLGGPVDG